MNQEIPQNNERQPQAGAQSAIPSGVGRKFHPDGSIRPFPGNTVICHLDQDSALFDALLRMRKTLAKLPFASAYTLLPPASWHMTVFEGVCDEIRKPSYWPSDLPMTAPLETCNALFEQKLQDFDLGSDAPFKVKPLGLQPLVDGIALNIQPATDDDEQRLRDLRDRLSELLLLKHEQHGSYAFHLSIGYLIRNLSPDEQRQLHDLFENESATNGTCFELGAPEFCRFDDMFAYDRQFYLKPQETTK